MHLLLLQAGNRREKVTTAGCCSQQMAIRSSRERAIGEHDALAGEISFNPPKTQYPSPFNTQPLHYGGGRGMRIRLRAISRLARRVTAACRFIGTSLTIKTTPAASPAAVARPEGAQVHMVFHLYPRMATTVSRVRPFRPGRAASPAVTRYRLKESLLADSM